MVLVSSCDSYSDLWEPFFKILSAEWEEVNNYKIVLNTESKEFAYENLKIICYRMFEGKRTAWGKRLIETLKRMDCKYVIFLLDDFFITEKVDQKQIDKCIEYLEEDDNIAYFSFVPVDDVNDIPSDKYPGFELRSPHGNWRLNTQAAVWRRDKLIEYVRPHESAWDWEIFGSERSQRYTEEFYVQQKECKRVFQYDNKWGGAIHRGKWTPSGVELCRKYNININFEERGYEIEPPPYDKPLFPTKLKGIRRIFRPPFLKRMKIMLRMYLIEIPQKRITRYKSLK